MVKKKDKQVKYIDIVFENCDVYRVTPDMIVMFSVDHLYSSLGVNCFQYTQGEVYNSLHCKHALLVLNKKAFNVQGMFEDSALEERLKWKDITHFDVIYTDKTNDYITVPWQNYNGNEYINALQNNLYQDFWYEDDECLMIVIKETPLTFGEMEEEYGVC